MAKKRGATPEQMFFAWLIQSKEFTPLTGTKNSAHMKQDLAVLDFTKLSQDEEAIFNKYING